MLVGASGCPWPRSSIPLGAMGTMGHGPKALWVPMAPGREINGYPFTTFTDLSDFLGIIPRVYVRILVRLAPILPILTSQ